jgi:7-keto-8-aminopelargonate synthetase-like enzyme
VPRDAEDEARLRRRLLRAGVFPSFLNYPGVPAGGAFRFTLSSKHARDQIQALIGALTG